MIMTGLWNKVLKGGIGLAASIALLLKNKDNLKALGKGVAHVAKEVLKK